MKIASKITGCCLVLLGVVMHAQLCPDLPTLVRGKLGWSEYGHIK